jgi:anaerobic selenocysteine-containing dehydrogenase
MTTITSYCRQCSGFCGVLLEVEGDQITSIRGDRDNPISLGHLCDAGRDSATMVSGPDRLTMPARRVGDRWETLEWDVAIAEIGERLGAVRTVAGPGAVGVMAGPSVTSSHTALTSSIAFAVAMGTPNLFTQLADDLAPAMYATERVVGFPGVLQPDVARASFTILFGGAESGPVLSPQLAGATWLAANRHARKAHKAKLAVVHPWKTPLAEEADQFLAVRPGTEVFLLLGMLNAIVDHGWHDAQFVADYCAGFDELARAVALWTPERVAAICGVERRQVGALALGFSRAPMGAVHPGFALARGPHPTVAHWAWLALHAVTANLLRPGGLYDNPGMLDMQPLLSAVPVDGAPRSRVAGVPAVGMQLPASVFVEEALTPGDGQLKGLVAIEADPASQLVPTRRARRALEALDVLVVLGNRHTATTAMADYVMPTPHFWERGERHFHLTGMFPLRFAQATAAVLHSRGGRAIDQVLGDLLKSARPPRTGGAWGLHLTLAARAMLRGGRTDAWLRRLWGVLGESGWEAVTSAPHGLALGEADRSAFRVATPSGRLDLAPADLIEAVQQLREPAQGTVHFAVRDGLEGTAVLLSPSAGVEEGAVSLKGGPERVQCTVTPDAAVVAGTVVGGPELAGRLAPAGGDAFVGTAQRWGFSVELLGG